MAEKSESSLLQVTVNFQGKRTVLHLPKNMKIGLAIQKAAEHFKQAPGGLTFLYHGLEITDDMTVGVALAQAHSVTVIHLIRAAEKKRHTATVMPSLERKEEVYGFCKECECLALSRDVFLCKFCKQLGSFQRSTSLTLNHFSGEINPEHLTGSCGVCNKENIQASVHFECVACDNGTTVCPLRQVRKNVYNIGCMKCGLRHDLMFRFACESRHCMCIDCFSNMCKQLLCTNKFRNFGDMGFSISCPGSGPDCKTTPVPDPHHFKIVDDPDFYDRFMATAMEHYTPSGDNILCSCKTVIDFQQSKPVNVQEPAGAPEPSVSGLKWYQKLFGLKPEAPVPRVRRRTSCASCQLTYCVACKQVWHEGDCTIISDDVIKEEQAYPITAELAHRGCWPPDKD